MSENEKMAETLQAKDKMSPSRARETKSKLEKA
jgi:hypothetical protein